jgi:hypothetical protein
MDALATFLTCGRLGALTSGMTKPDVRRLLGEPRDVSVQKNPETWKYGPLQLGFHKDRGETEASLRFLGLYFHDAGPLPDRLAWAGWFPSSATTPADFQEFLARQGLEAQAKVEGEANDYVIMTSGVRVTFADGQLDSIQFLSRQRHERQQVTVSIPAEAWQRLREEAVQRKVSMSELCSQWIGEHVKELCKSEARG